MRPTLTVAQTTYYVRQKNGRGGGEILEKKKSWGRENIDIDQSRARLESGAKAERGRFEF